MMVSELFVSDQRMLHVMAWAISEKEKDVTTEKAFCALVGFNFRNLPKVKTGAVSFTKEHILRCAQVFGTDLNWLFGLGNTMIRAEQTAATKPATHTKKAASKVAKSL